MVQRLFMLPGSWLRMTNTIINNISKVEIIKKSLIKSIQNKLKNNDICLDELIKKLTDLKKVIVICGPTCAGKSRIGVIMAKLLDTDIISVDSMQVYRGMDIGTDKYDLAGFGVKQYMTDIFDPDHDLSIKEFKKIYPYYAKKVSENDQRRIIRALEVYEITGPAFSSLQNPWKSKKSEYEASLIGITLDRKKLYDNIDKRVDRMLENGLIEEVKKLIDDGYKNCRSVLQAVGYKEVLKYLNGEITFEECSGYIKRNTRRLAKT